jgi:hypothetical protein
MMRTFAGVLGLFALLLSGTAVRAAEEVVPFHATLELVEDCESSPNPSEQCQGFPEWLATCQAQGYDWAFSPCGRSRDALGRVTSFEQGCLDFGPAPAIVRSYGSR